mgnify:CR=1 FL=1
MLFGEQVDHTQTVPKRRALYYLCIQSEFSSSRCGNELHPQRKQRRVLQVPIGEHISSKLVKPRASNIRGRRCGLYLLDLDKFPYGLSADMFVS